MSKEVQDIKVGLMKGAIVFLEHMIHSVQVEKHPIADVKVKPKKALPRGRKRNG